MKCNNNINSNSVGFKVDLMEKFPMLKKILKSRYFQFSLMTLSLFIFYIIIIAGFSGTPIGNRNSAIVVLWIFWWFLMISVLVPFGARFWCTICPLPFFGDFLQRRTFLKVNTGKTSYLKNKLFGLNKVWPKRIKNIWIPNFTFLTLCTFSAILVTRPFVTSVVLTIMIVTATVLAAIFRLRAFCGYVCPVSGFIGLYSKAATLELRTKDNNVCNSCTDRGCFRGNEKGWGCPWGEDMKIMDRNNYCGLCMECVKTCPNDNIALNVRPFASEVNITSYDESWKGFIDVGTSHVYSLIYLGTSGTLKDMVNAPESGNWAGFFAYMAVLWLVSLVIVPSIFFSLSWLSKKLSGVTEISVKKIFKAYSYVLIPVGLLAWIAFSFPLIFINGSYVLNVLSDPLGWGWDLFGTANLEWHPMMPDYLGYIQVALLLTGLAYSIIRGYAISKKLFSNPVSAFRAQLPFALFTSTIAIAFIIFFIG